MWFIGRFISRAIFILTLFVNIKVSITQYGIKQWNEIVYSGAIQCPNYDEDKLVTTSNTCYYSFCTKKSFEEADKKCNTFNGHLLWLDKKNEHEFISKQLLECSGLKTSWLGLTRQKNGNFHWSSYGRVFSKLDNCKWLPRHPLKFNIHAAILKIAKEIFYISISNEKEQRPYICETCFFGYYGTNCMTKCGHCKYYANCNSITGLCPGGCQEGWSEPRCNVKICPKTFYGEKCNQRCGKCKDNMTCDYKTGICKNGCKDHWTGEKCQQQLFREIGLFGDISEGEYLRLCGTIYSVNGIRVEARKNIFQAQKQCCKKNAHLLWLETKREENFILKNILQRMPLPSSWLGAGSFNSTYKWISCNNKKNMTYQNWYISPFAQHASYLALKMMDYQKTTWVNIYSDIKLPYICEKCIDGYYGEDCNLKCNHCLNSVCDVITGYCLHGCIPGYHGKKCDIDRKHGVTFSRGRRLYLAFGRHSGRRNFYEAQSECCHLGLHLLWLESKEEEEFIKNNILKNIQEDIVWLGAIKKKNKYFWLSCSNKTDGINLGSKNNSQGDHVYLKRGASRWQSTFGSFFYIPFICEGCRHGFYGPDCSFDCGKCSNNSTCNAITGRCFKGCDDGWHGLKCDILNNDEIQMDSIKDEIQMDSVKDEIQMDSVKDEIQMDSIKDEIQMDSVKEKDFIGCYADKEGDRAMKDRLTSSKDMTIKLCQDDCRNKNFMFAALQYGIQCFCGNDGYDRHGKSENCTMECQGNPLENCGGYWANAVYKVGEKNFLGCYADKEGDRALNDRSILSKNMTVKYCKNYCSKSQFLYAALQYGIQCFCGNDGYDRHGKSKKCKMECQGNPLENCGGHWANAVYKVGEKNFLGCYADKEGDRALNDRSILSKNMTVKYCKNYCSKSQFLYAALQYGIQCFCGNDGYDRHGKSKKCTMECQGNPLENCGGHWANAVYKVGEKNFIGCYADKEGDRAMKDRLTSSKNMTIKLCQDDCRNKNFMFAALQYGIQCFCGNDGYDRHGKSENCTMECQGNPLENCGGYWANAVYKVGEKNFIGCYADKEGDRAMKDRLTSSKNMTIKFCQDDCRNENFKFAALQYGIQCFCGNDGYDRHGKSKNCTMECQGNPLENCGGYWANAVYKVGEKNFLGCYADKEGDRALNDRSILSKNMTVKFCKNYCSKRQFIYAALQYGIQCFCGNDGYDRHGKSKNCTMECLGNPLENCGGYWANAVYKVGEKSFIERDYIPPDEEIEGIDFMGCYADQNNRAMSAIFISSDSMSVNWCKDYCRIHRFKYAAVQYRNQCFCGNGGFRRYGRSNNCDMNCQGNPRENCGGFWANAVYKVGEKDFMGCFADQSNRAMNDRSVSSETMTVSWCKDYCRNENFRYAGLQYGKECFCGNDDYERYGRSENCKMVCRGNPYENCGGYWAIAVYRVAENNFIGCFADQSNRAMNEKSTTSEKMTIKLCQDYCRNENFRYAGLQYGKECFCGNGGYERYGRSENCKMVCRGNPYENCGGFWAIAVYRVAEKDFMGCYIDQSNRAMNDRAVSSETMTVSWCKDYCRNENFRYAGLQYGKECFCGNGGFQRYGKSYHCTMACQGDSRENCGGFWAIAVYKVRDEYPPVNILFPVDQKRYLYFPEKPLLVHDYIPTEEENEGIDYIGCFPDHKNWSMEMLGTYDNLTITFCINKCREKDYEYAGLQNSNSCFCINQFDGSSGYSTECNKKCAGNDLTICGGSSAISLYKV